MTEWTRTYKTSIIQTFTGASVSELRSWAERAYIERPDSYGLGRPLEWTLEAVLKAEIMVRLIRVGFTPLAASHIADWIRNEEDGVMTINLGHGIFLHQDRPTAYVQSVLDMLDADND